MSGSLFCKIGDIKVKMPDLWIDEDSFNQITRDEMIDLVKEDVNSFVEDINLFDHIEFYWR